MSPEGLQRLAIRAPVFDPDHFTRERWIRMAPGAQVVVAEHVAWPEGVAGARLVVPDRGGLWVNPLPNEFGRAGATFFLPLPDGE